MSADLLRRAAALMRERAAGVPSGPWVPGEQAVWQAGMLNTAEIVTPCEHGQGGARTRNGAAYIASWHPAVALAVADWLDSEATAMENGNAEPPRWVRRSRARSVARTYLGETS